MVAAAAADRTIAQIEIERMHSMVRELPAFRGVDDAWFGREAQACGKLLSRPDGVNKVVRLIGEALIGELRETAYALAAEVAASDLALQADEKSFLDLLGDGLRLDELTRAALQRTARVRHRST
ncbi:tellurite resistance TerB family protein [Hyphomicrobium sp. 1Nfss2.1]|uniref:tellurite resistance TerB family protein n=1 Tax=Hyphomicrobium sp. 1Nfss2.1 TaxID=3413936 RepID=UPI003C7C5F39